MERVRRAFVMAVLEQYLGLVIAFGVIACLSRLLTPSQIGVSAIASGIALIVFSVREFATPEFLIQREQVEREDIRTAFTVLVGLNFLLSLGLCLASPWLATFYGEHGLELFLILTAAAALVEAAAMPTFTLMRRDMAFGTVTRIKTIGSAAGAVATIAFAWTGFGYLSIAMGALIGSTASTVLAFWAKPTFWLFRPSLASWRHVAGFGFYKGATYMTDRAYEALPQLALGRVMPLASVGVFNRANVVCNMPDRILMSSIFTVAFPALAEAVREGRNLRETYLRSLGYIAVIYWPATILLSILAEPAVNVVLGPGWGEAVPIVQILSLSSAFWFPVILTYPLLVALGANRDAFTSNLIGRAVAAVVLCSSCYFGLIAMALSQFISLPFQMILSLSYVRRHVGFAWSEIVGAIAGSAGVTLCALAGPLALVGAHGFTFHLSVVDAVVCAALAGVGWLAGLIVFRHPFLAELRGLTKLLNRPMPFPRFGLRRPGAPSMTSASTTNGS